MRPCPHMLWCLERKKTRTNQHWLRLRLKTAKQRASRGPVPHTLELNAYYTFVWLAYAKTNGSFNLQLALQGSTRSWTAQLGYQLYTCVYKDFHLQYLFSEQLGRRRPMMGTVFLLHRMSNNLKNSLSVATHQSCTAEKWVGGENWSLTFSLCMLILTVDGAFN
jgi:hypothetical protein